MFPIKVATMGDNCIDFYVGRRPPMAVGGNALNVAVGFARQNVSCEYIGVVGDDSNGAFIRQALRKAGVGIERLRIVPGPSWFVEVGIDAGGTARVESEDPGVCGPLTPDDAERAYAARFDHVHMANLADPGSVLSDLRRRGANTSYDFGANCETPTAAMPDIAFFSCGGSERKSVAIDLVRNAVDRGARLAVATLGAGGSIAWENGSLATVPAKPIAPIDTLGAGDSYIATLLAKRLAGAELETAMRAASEAAASTCMHWAGWPQTLDVTVGTNTE